MSASVTFQLRQMLRSQAVSKLPVFLNFFLFLCIKGALCSFGEEIQTQNCNINNINEVMIQTGKYVISPLLNKQAVPRTLFGARKVAGSAK